MDTFDIFDRLYQANCLRIFRGKWVMFTDAWKQSDKSKRAIGDWRKLLEDRLGGQNRDALVQSIDKFMKGDNAGHETQACLDKMEEFWKLSTQNTTDMAKYTENSPIERRFLAAQKAMRKYQLAIEGRQKKAAAKAAKAAKRNAGLHVLLHQLQTMADDDAFRV
jgi:hypothetical protein